MSRVKGVIGMPGLGFVTQFSKLAGVLILGLLSAVSVCAQTPTKLKVYISTDMEGLDGVSSYAVQSSSGAREYGQFRRLLTEEANAAVAGAFDAGASEVWVSDSHADGQNIDVELIDKRAHLIRGWPRPLGMLGGIDTTFDAVAFVGFHAREGAADATLPHTFNGSMRLALNGVTVGEIGFDAAIAGELGIPVVFVSGDQAAAQEAHDLLGNLETAEVKHALGYHAEVMVPLDEARRRIREGVAQGVRRRSEIKPYRPAHPVEVTITFNNVLEAELFSYLPRVTRPRGDTIDFPAADMIEASKFLEVVLHRTD